MIITLIGMPACGKSCMGRALSRKLKMKNIDGDKVIEKRTGRALQDIIDNDGLDAFKKIEEETLLSIDEDNIILSPGGSAVYYERAMNYLRSKGPIVYIYVGVENIIKRLGDFSKRGIAMRPDQTIYDLYRERSALFEKYADITINCDGEAYPKYQNEAVKAINEYVEKNRSK